MKTSNNIASLAMTTAVASISLAPNFQAAVLTFQQGDGGAFSDTAATWIEERNTNNWGNAPEVKLEEEYRTSTHLLTQGLLGFFDIMGNSIGQIAPGSTVNSANLTLTFDDAGSAGTLVTLHQMLKPWVETEATWAQRQDGEPFGNGPFVATVGDPVAPGGGEEGVDYSAEVIDGKGPSPIGQISFDITPVVQAWADGDPNHGLYLRYRNGNFARFYSDDAATLGDRPLLAVDFTPIPEPSGTAMFGLAGLALMLRRRR